MIILILGIITLNFISSVFYAHGTVTPLVPNFGNTPDIDGVIDRANNEWDDSLKTSLTLYQNISIPINGLAIDLWILQDETSLYIAIQFELENHGTIEFDEEFVGILISKGDSDPDAFEDITDVVFEDLKIVQFSNISGGDFEYVDYFINESIYYLDDESNGDGAAKLDGNEIAYEFMMPVDVFDDSHQDVFLDEDFIYAFNIIFGKSAIYPDGIILNNIVITHVQFAPYTPAFTEWELVLLTLNFIIFGTIGALFCFYLYRITKLKEKIRRIRR
jgi:hypothetical protein